MLEQSLRRLQTDHLDLWQIHGVSFQNDPELFIRPGGAAEALLNAKKAGKVRFLGFSGHKDPEIHLAMLNTGFPFDAVQMPLNPFDANFFSFEQEVSAAMASRFKTECSPPMNCCVTLCRYLLPRPSLAFRTWKFCNRT
jgi:aryl-alcohol dehydrogenase-like predicted oxidoreductase